MLLFSGQAAPALELFFVPSPARPLLPSLPSVTLLRQPLPVGITFTYGYWSKVSRTTHDAVIPLSPRLLYVGSRAVPPKPISDGTLTVRQTLTARDTARNPPVDDNSTSAMATPELRQRQTASPSNEGTTPNGVLRKDKGAEQRLKHGILMQLFRTLLLSTWFNCCCVCIVVTQLIGSPLYFINKDYYYGYMAWTKRCFGIVITALTEWGCPTLVRVSGDKSVRGQIQLTKDGRLKTEFSERLVLIANHQVYTDWLYLWWIAYTNRMHGHIFIILKESLKYIPIIGQGMMFYGFIFMARKWLSDKPRLQHRLEKLKSKHSGPLSGSQQLDPMWLLIYPEGTNLSVNTKKASDAYSQKKGLTPFKHVLLPRSTGLFFCLQQLKGTVDWLYDCTVAYEGPP